MKLEVCVESVGSALKAFGGGASRIELCTALHLGGLTPSLGLLKVVRALLPPTLKIFVMIRTKPSTDYIYEDHEIDVMAEDIKIFRQNGADGFVFGCLNEEKAVHVEACKKLVEMAKGFPCTFHRAFDEVKDPEGSVAVIANLGFSRILTSGQQENAYLGRHLIRNLVDRVNELKLDMTIMAGGGIDLDNLADILNVTNVKEFHGSARSSSHKHLDKGNSTWETDESVVKEMIRIADSVATVGVQFINRQRNPILRRLLKCYVNLPGQRLCNTFAEGRKERPIRPNRCGSFMLAEERMEGEWKWTRSGFANANYVGGIPNELQIYCQNEFNDYFFSNKIKSD